MPVIRGHPTEIKQLFQNLIVNAIKFRREGVSPVIKIKPEKKPGFWQFSVSDNGIGIDEKHKDRIFIIFQRLHTRDEYEGSGIGLSHCKKIAELHGGKIWVESVPGEGSTFYFTIREM
jgi:light-regulated signal transduction histidine kinase (bacteriophytochrome)